MEKERIKELVHQYLHHELNIAEMEEVEKYIASGKLSLSDFEDLEKINQQLDFVAEAETSPELDRQFYTMLGAEKEKLHRKDWIKNFFISLPTPVQWALPVVLLLLGMAIGGMWNTGDQIESANIVHEDAEVINSLISDPSTSIRLAAVNKTADMENEEDKDIISILLFTLNNDKSSNVRIASIDALLRYGDQAEVREGLVDAIRHQDSPLVLQNIAEALKILGEDLPIEKYRELINKNLPPVIVKDLEANINSI